MIMRTKDKRMWCGLGTALPGMDWRALYLKGTGIDSEIF